MTCHLIRIAMDIIGFLKLTVRDPCDRVIICKSLTLSIRCIARIEVGVGYKLIDAFFLITFSNQIVAYDLIAGRKAAYKRKRNMPLDTS